MISLMWFPFDPCHVGDWPSRSCTKDVTILDHLAVSGMAPRISPNKGELLDLSMLSRPSFLPKGSLWTLDGPPRSHEENFVKMAWQQMARWKMWKGYERVAGTG